MASWSSWRNSTPGMFDPRSPTQLVGGIPSPTFEQVMHDVPMLSLEKANTLEELQRFFKRCEKARPGAVFMATPKMDGLAVSLLYEGGELVRGATRGDGEVGEDITASLRVVKGVLPRLPKEGPGSIEVRGEVYLSHSAFDKANEQQRGKGDKEFVSPRNAAAGTVRQKDVRLTASRGLEFQAYWAIPKAEETAKSAQETYASLRKMGFTVTEPCELVRDIVEFVLYRDTTIGQAGERDYDIDGVVLRLDHTPTAISMGSNAKSPRAMIAFKFPADMVSTKVVGIDFQIGRTGSVTPVAKLEGVKIGGVTVTSATLHNCQMLKDMDVRVGDEISLIRAGDVIPKVVRVNKEARDDGEEEVSLPEACSYCGEGLAWDSVNLVCSNEACKGKLVAYLRHFVSRQAMDIEGFGDRRIEALVDKGHVKRPADIFSLEQSVMADIERMGDKSADNLGKAIRAASETTLSRVLNALGIAGLGTTGAKALAETFGSLAAIESVMPESACFVGPVQYGVARAVQDSLSGGGGEELRLMLERGVKWPEPGPQGMHATVHALLMHVKYLSDAVPAYGSDGPGKEESERDWPKVSQRLLDGMRELPGELHKVEDLLDLDVLSKVYGSEKHMQSAREDIERLAQLPRFKRLVSELEKHLRVTWGAAPAAQGLLAGMGIVVTGALPGKDRKAAKQLVLDHGGRPGTAVSSNTDLLVVGEKPGKGKVEEAGKRGVRTMEAVEFLEWLEKDGK